jgi:hypothetical protein
MDKFYAEFRLREGNVFIKDEISEEILKACNTMAEIKPLYLKSQGLTWRDLKSWRLHIPVGMEEDDE